MLRASSAGSLVHAELVDLHTNRTYPSPSSADPHDLPQYVQLPLTTVTQLAPRRAIDRLRLHAADTDTAKQSNVTHVTHAPSRARQSVPSLFGVCVIPVY